MTALLCALLRRYVAAYCWLDDSDTKSLLSELAGEWPSLVVNFSGEFGVLGVRLWAPESTKNSDADTGRAAGFDRMSGGKSGRSGGAICDEPSAVSTPGTMLCT